MTLAEVLQRAASLPKEKQEELSDTAMLLIDSDIILKPPVEGFVGANSFAHNSSSVRMNSHPQNPHNRLKYLMFFTSRVNLG